MALRWLPHKWNNYMNHLLSMQTIIHCNRNPFREITPAGEGNNFCRRISKLAALFPAHREWRHTACRDNQSGCIRFILSLLQCSRYKFCSKVFSYLSYFLSRIIVSFISKIILYLSLIYNSNFYLWYIAYF